MSAPQLHHLVYQSVVTNPLSEEELESLLTQSRTWNTSHDLTGLLLYSEGEIMQVLEGPVDEVRYIFARIQQDVRHRNVTLLADGPIAERNFSEWSMGFQTVRAEEFRHLAGYRNPSSQHYLADYKTSGEDSLRDVLSSFVQHRPEIRF